MMSYNFYNEVLMPVVRCIEKFADRNAFCINRDYYTYSQLGESINAIRTAVVFEDCRNSNVGLVINDDLNTYASIFALWLEGMSYVPLHPHWPLERCLDIVKQVEINLILDSSAKTRYEDVNVLMTNTLKESSVGIEPKSGISEDDLAYILFTSGSMGKPKGVQLMRKNVASFMDGFWKSGIDLNEEDRCLQVFDLSFDVSVQSYLVALTRGACAYTIPYGKTKYIYASRLIEDHRITFGAMAPSMLKYLKPYFEEIDATSLKTCILTAEACPLDLVEEWFKVAKNTEMYDFYGPTEATIYCTYYKLTRGAKNKSLNGIISIGKPMVNVMSIILDENGNELPPGEKGELCVAGDQVAKGYWKNDEKNQESFFYREINGRRERFYRTGDLCYADEDGDILYSGRLDHQTKIQGFRVEMGEIEYHAREFLGGTNVVCMAFDNKSGLTEIAMFIEMEEKNTDELIEYLKTQLPLYMIPARLFFVPVFELNENDKIDKNKLRALIK